MARTHQKGKVTGSFGRQKELTGPQQREKRHRGMGGKKRGKNKKLEDPSEPCQKTRSKEKRLKNRSLH